MRYDNFKYIKVIVSIVMSSSGLTIGKIANLANVSVETIRYYQQIGLLHEPEKPVQGFRKYSDDNIRELKFIKKAQRLGFTLNEISELLEIGAGKCSDIKTKAQIKRDQISQQVKELQAMENTLNNLIESCSHSSEITSCPIVKTLSEL